MSKISTTVETVTPELAAHWLSQNCSNNRNRSQSRVNELCRAIQSGNWILTHQGIAFSDNGELLDGQHRLAAILQAGTAVQMSVTRGLPKESFRVMDRGWNRGLRTVCQADQSIVEGCAYLARLHQINHVQSYHVDAIATSPVGEAMLRLRTVCSTRARRRAAAPVLTAAALRWFQASEYVEEQWRAFILLQFPDMSSVIQAFCRQIADGGKMASNELVARAWIAFDPARRYHTKIQLSDQAGVLEEIRRHYQPPWKVEVANEGTH